MTTYPDLRASPADRNGIGTARERALCGLIQAGGIGPLRLAKSSWGLDGVAAASAAAGAEGLLADRSDGRALLVGCRWLVAGDLGACSHAMW